MFNQLSFMSPHQLGDFPVTNTPTEHVPELTSLIRCVWAGELPNCVKFQTYRVTEWLLSCMTRFSRPSLAPNSECSTPSIGISWYYRVGERLLLFFFLQPFLITFSCTFFSDLSVGSYAFFYNLLHFNFPARRYFSLRTQLAGGLVRVCLVRSGTECPFTRSSSKEFRRNKTACNWPKVFSIERRMCLLYLRSMEMSFPA